MAGVTAVSNTSCIVAALSAASIPGYIFDATLAYTDLSNMRSLFGEMQEQGRVQSYLNVSYSTIPYADSDEVRRRLLSQCSLGASTADHDEASCTLTATGLDPTQAFYLLAFIEGPPISFKDGSVADFIWDIPYTVTLVPASSGERFLAS